MQLGVIIFGLIRFLYKKSNQTEMFFFKKPKPVQTDRFRFGSVLARFFDLARLFSGLARFFSVWVRFGFFGFRLIKPKSNRTGRFFQNFNWFHRFFSRFGFFSYFFPVFSVFQFFAHPYVQ